MGRAAISTVMSVTVTVVAICSFGSAQVSSSSTNTTPAAEGPPIVTFSSDQSLVFIDAHNEARKEVNVGPLKWSQTLAKSASLTVRYQREYENCSFANVTNNLFGQNQMLSYIGVDIPPRRVVGTWLAGKMYYDYGSNTCREGHSCNSYTQIVWTNTAELGCAQVQCPLRYFNLTLCYYSPPGNVAGQKPY